MWRVAHNRHIGLPDSMTSHDFTQEQSVHISSIIAGGIQFANHILKIHSTSSTILGSGDALTWREQLYLSTLQSSEFVAKDCSNVLAMLQTEETLVPPHRLIALG